MSVMDEFKAEREKLKHGTFKQKLQYFWCYYKVHAIVILACVIAFSSFIYNIVTNKEVVFDIAFVNTASPTPTGRNDFAQLTIEALNIDADQYTIRVDDSTFIDIQNPNAENNYYAIQKLSVLMMTSNLDITVMNTELIRSYAYSLAFTDLRDILTEEQLKKYEPYFYYIDYAVYEEIQQAQDAGLMYEKPYPDPTQPDKMEMPIPTGIYIRDASVLNQYYVFEDDAILSIPSGASHIESAVAFLDFIFSENNN